MAHELRHLDDSLWVHETPLRFLGLEIGRRMTVRRLGDGTLLVHSPAPLTRDLRAELDALGPVRHVVPASRLHGHLWMEHYAEAWPNCRLYAVPGLERKRSDLSFAVMLFDAPDQGWGDDVDVAPLLGNRAITELEFLHRPSRSLVFGDAGYHVASDRWPPLTRLVARLVEVRGRLAPTRDFRLAIRDRAAARRSLERILAWDFDRVIVAHGDIVETGGRAALRDGFDWLFGSGTR